MNQGAFGDADGDGATSAGRSAGSKATINQSHSGNAALVNQGFESGEAIGSMATVTQTGTNNRSKINQSSLNFGQDNASKAIISQAGTGSRADIRQGYLATSTNNEATITQMATANGVESQIFQGSGGKSSSKNDKAEVIQGGNGTNFLGYAGIFQGSVLYTSGTATSSGNMAKITQAAGTFNNEADINQGFETSGSAIDNKATIEQKRGIPCVFKVSLETVLLLVKVTSQHLPAFRESILPAHPQDIIEFDEVWFSSMTRNKLAGSGRLFVGAPGRSLPGLSATTASRHSGNSCASCLMNTAVACPIAPATRSDAWRAYNLLLNSSARHEKVGKESGQTNHMEPYRRTGWNNTLRQRISRYVRKALSFSKTDMFHQFTTKLFIWHYNLERINTF